jgi:16S rRNA (cytidine1402-2'-O)-methyltransferase
VVADLADLGDGLGGSRSIVVARELTKAFEEVWRGTLDEAVGYWSSQALRGEFTLVIGGAERQRVELSDLVARVGDLVGLGESMADAVRRTASEAGVSRRSLYEAVLRDQD